MATMENRKVMTTLYERFPELTTTYYSTNLIPVVIGIVGRGATQETIDYCIEDLKNHDFELWNYCFMHYKDMFGYTADPKACPECGQYKEENK